MHVTVPPAIHAPAKVCGDYKPQYIENGDSAVLHSPDCKWVLVFQSEVRPKPDFPLKGHLSDDQFVVADAKTGQIIARLGMERRASIHWLKDNRYLIVNYYAGSDASLPLIFDLKPIPAQKPRDLASLVFSDVLHQAHIKDHRGYARNRWVYHYYVNYYKDVGSNFLIAAQPWYTLQGKEGPGLVKCYIYSVNKITLHYRLINEEPDIEHCPHNPDEKWD